VLAAAGVPAPLAAVRLGATYAEVRAARPASQHSLGLGRFEELAGWTAHYRFDAPPPGRTCPLEEVTRREPGPGQPMLRAEFGRPVPADSAEARWAVAAARAQGAAGAAARCARFAVPGWGPERPVDRQGAVAYVPLPGRSGAPRARVAVAYAVSVADAGAPSGGAAARPPPAGSRSARSPCRRTMWSPPWRPRPSRAPRRSGPPGQPPRRARTPNGALHASGMRGGGSAAATLLSSGDHSALTARK
jgi:hypothetical protein